MKRVCIIGGSGFLGSHVATQLSNKNYDVTIFDKYESNWLEKNQQMIVGDITDRNSLKDALKNIDIVYNFAGIADLDDAIRKPIETVELNILGNVYALEASKKNNVKKFVYASSQYVNSREGSFYRCSKHASELYVEEYKNYFNFIILRFGSLYGPRSGADNGLFRIVKSALIDGTISYQGNKDAIREYIHIDDATKGSIEILKEKYANKVIVLTGQESMRVYEVLNTLSEILGYKNKVIFRDEIYPGHYIRTPYAFNPRIGYKFSPKTHIDLGQGLIDLIYYVKEVIEKNSQKSKKS